MHSLISYKNIWKISLPIIVSGITQNIITVTDTMFLGKIGKIALGAAGNAGIFYFILILTGMGFTTGSQIIIARRNGEKNYSKIGTIVDHTFYFIVPLAILLFLLIIYLSPLLLETITKSANILQGTIDYLNYRSFGILFTLINFVFIAFYIGTTETKVITYTTTLLMLTNVFFDYALIFGKFGFPEMGIKGAALASSIADFTAFLFFLIYTFKKIDLKKYGLFLFNNIELKTLKQILNIGSPIMLQNFLSVASWFIFFIIIEQIGEQELAISHIVRSIYMVLVIPLFGFSSATNTLVSNLIGEGNGELVISLIKKVMWLAIICTSTMLLSTIFFPERIIHLYTHDAGLIKDTIPTLKVINFTIFPFCIAIILFSGISGTGNTKISLIIEAMTISIYLIATYYIAIVFKSSLPTIWCSEFIYFGLLGLLSFLYLTKGNWKKKVI